MSEFKASNLVKSYGSKTVVNQVSLQVEQGEIVGLLGPNGAGKSTTFSMMMGIVKPDVGTITLNGKEITKLPLSKRARLGIGYLAQEPSLFRQLSVEQNIQVVLENMPLTKIQRQRNCERLLDEAGLSHLAKQNAASLSGGEKRRMEICRALAAKPRIILLDEPFSGVDPKSVAELQEVILQLKQRHLGVLITDHSVRETLEVTDRAYIMHNGVILTQGNARELVNDPVVREAYLGDKFYMREEEIPETVEPTE